jgi:hypothetical protein
MWRSSNAYAIGYDLDLGYPWTTEGQERWMKVSYPFFKADPR